MQTTGNNNFITTTLQRSKSSPLPYACNFCQVHNDVVLPAHKTLKYMDTLPPPSMLYYKDTFHRVFNDIDMQRYIKYKGQVIYLKNIIGQYFYSEPE